MKAPISKSSKARNFDQAYEGPGMYYGWDVRPEFSDFFGNMALTGLQALDLGAGEGRYAVYLARRGCAVTAVDFSASGLNKLKAIAGREQLSIVTELRDLENYAFKQAAHDVVVAATILDHLEEPARRRTRDGMVNALKPEGLIYANVFTTHDPGYRAAADPETREGVSDTSFGMAHYFAPGELKSCFPELTILYYYEGVEKDTSHGRPHHHGWASLIARKD